MCLSKCPKVAGGFLAVLAMMCSSMLGTMEMVLPPHLLPRASVEVNEKNESQDRNVMCCQRGRRCPEWSLGKQSLYPRDRPLRTQRAGEQVESKSPRSKVSLSTEGGAQSNPLLAPGVLCALISANPHNNSVM